MLPILALEFSMPGTGAIVLAIVAVVVLVLLWKTLKFAIKIALFVGVGLLLYKGAQWWGFI